MEVRPDGWTLTDDGGVAAFRKRNQQSVSGAFVLIVALESCAQPTRLHAYQRVSARVEGVFLPEDLNRNDVFLQGIASPLQGLCDDEVQKALETLGRLKRATTEDTRQLLRDGLLVVGSGRRR